MQKAAAALVIYGETGSAAEKYAKENGISFKPVLKTRWMRKERKSLSAFVSYKIDMRLPAGAVRRIPRN